MPRDQLIIQLPVTEATDFDALIYIEELLIQALSQNNLAEVDGHDIGEGKFNIFVFPNGSWESVIEKALDILKVKSLLNDAHIVRRLKTSEEYVSVWPKQYSGEFEL